MLDEPLPALGMVPLTGRGSLAFELLHGESLVACAAWALGAAGVEPVDFNVEWPQIRDSGRTLVLHDPLCPATPAELIAQGVHLAESSAKVVVAFRVVTDTVKRVDGDLVHETVDRDALRQVVSPIVLPAVVVAALGEAPDASDFARLVETLRGTWPVQWLEAPDLARRIGDSADLAVLAALSAPRPR